MKPRFSLPDQPRILVITLRRLGDVLLTTPLVRTLRRRYPQATLEMLVFGGSAGILEGNPDIDRVITIAERPSLLETVAIARRIWRHYHLAVSTQTGDRPTAFAMLAGQQRVGLVPQRGGGAWWKRLVYDATVVAAPDTHRVDALAALSDALGLPREHSIVCPRPVSPEKILVRSPYAVLHASPLYNYKRWHDGGWRELGNELIRRGLSIVLSEGPEPSEREYIDTIWRDAGVSHVRTHGRLDWGALAQLLQGAAVYVGTDTSVTHLAAGSGCPTIAIYGPTSPRIIAPWPVGGPDRPWDHAGMLQNRGNVWVVQTPLPCMPCERLGCERHLVSRSACLDELPVSSVLRAVDEALLWSRARLSRPQ